MAVAQHGGALEDASAELRAPAATAALISEAARLRAGGPLVAALQRLAFAACFTAAGDFALAAGGGPSSARELAAGLAPVPTVSAPGTSGARPWRSLAFEAVRRSPALHGLPGLELIGKGWLLSRLPHDCVCSCADWANRGSVHAAGRASEQGWGWRSAAGLALTLPPRAEVEGMAEAVAAEATDDY